MTPELRGVAFPFRIRGGGLRETVGFEKVIENVRHLLGTRLGERPMLRTYGGGAHHRLQEPNTSTLRTVLRHEMEQALRTYMPEVKLTSPIQLAVNGSELRIAIDYKASPRDAVRRLELTLP